ncbi:hypothetical protein HDU67_008750 [Dinochytrium kinnereticum]|nr:hypothetical protein HDU67_008750 [Dinochytrium kinnereticum]
MSHHRQRANDDDDNDLNSLLRRRETSFEWTSDRQRCRRDIANAALNGVRTSKLDYMRELKAHYGCVNALAFSGDGRFLASGGDDTRVLIWPILELDDRLAPTGCYTGHDSNIFCVGFGSDPNTFYSCGNDGLLIRHRIDQPVPSLFSKKSSSTHVGGRLMIEKSSDERIMAHDGAVLKLSVQPNNDEIVATAGQDGYVKLWDMRCPEKLTGKIFGFSGQNSVMFNPVMPEIVVTAADDGRILLQDLRMSFDSPKHTRSFYRGQSKRHVMNYTTMIACDNKWAKGPSAISAAFSPCGKLIGASLQRWRPTIYSVDDSAPIATLRSRIDGIRFNGKGDAGCQVGRQGYSSCCTVKTGAFSPDSSTVWCCPRPSEPDKASKADSVDEVRGDYEGQGFSDGTWKNERFSWSKRSAVFALGSDDFRAYGWAIPSVRELLDRRISFHPNDTSVSRSIKGKVIWLVPDGKMHLPVELGSEDFAIEGNKINEQGAKRTRIINEDMLDRPSRIRLFASAELDEHMEEDTSTLTDFDFLIMSEACDDTLWRTNCSSSEESSSDSSEANIHSDLDDLDESDAADGDDEGHEDSEESGIQPLRLNIWRRNRSSNSVPSLVEERESARRIRRTRSRSSGDGPEENIPSDGDIEEDERAEGVQRRRVRNRRRAETRSDSSDEGTSECSYFEESDDVWDILDASVSPMPDPETVISRALAEDSDDELERVFSSTGPDSSFTTIKRVNPTQPERRRLAPSVGVGGSSSNRPLIHDSSSPLKESNAWLEEDEDFMFGRETSTHKMANDAKAPTSCSGSSHEPTDGDCAKGGSAMMEEADESALRRKRQRLDAEVD